ncbi:MAG: class I SAM-dependent methyltransferase [Xanthobacteraceae bacterium]
MIASVGNVRDMYQRLFGYPMAGRHEPCDLCGSSKSIVVGRYDRRLRPLKNVMCSHCGLIRQDPMPTDSELEYFYEREYRVQQKGAAEPHPRNVERNLERSAARLEHLKPHVRPGAKILDVGSGAGDFVHLAARAGYDVRGIEPNLAYAEWSKKNFGIDVTVGTWETAEVAPGSCDLITSHHVLEHLRSPFAVLRKFHQWLKPDGRLWLAVPNLKWTVNSPINRFQLWHMHGFTPETHQMMALKAGFARITGLRGRSTEALLQRLPAPAENWFLFPDHAREMQQFFREHTLIRYVLRPKAYARAAQLFARALRTR